MLLRNNQDDMRMLWAALWAVEFRRLTVGLSVGTGNTHHDPRRRPHPPPARPSRHRRANRRRARGAADLEGHVSTGDCAEGWGTRRTGEPMRRKTMTKKPATRGPKKMSALRGPKLFGKVMPYEHYVTRTAWRGERSHAWVQDLGGTWSCGFSLDDMVSQRGTGFSSRAAAIRGLSRSLSATAVGLCALGWEPKR